MEADDLRAQDAAVNEVGERLIADRLDALEAEKIIARALELESKALSEPNLMTSSQLEQIAREIGVDETYIRQAIREGRLESLLEPTERSWFARLMLGDALFETATITGLTAEQAEAAVEKWMQNHEGMIKGGLLDDGAEWNVDRRWRARTKAKTLRGGNRMSRVVGGDVSHRVQSVGEQEHVVALESSGVGPLSLARLILAAGGVTVLLLIIGAISKSSWGILFGFVPVYSAVWVGLAAGAARFWGRAARGALRRSLAGLVDFAKTGPTLFSRIRDKVKRPPAPPRAPRNQVPPPPMYQPPTPPHGQPPQQPPPVREF